MLCHIRVDARWTVVRSQMQMFDRNTVLLHDGRRSTKEQLRMAFISLSLERRINEQGAKIVEIRHCIHRGELALVQS